MNPFKRKLTASTSHLPDEPPVGSLVQEIYGNGDLWQRTQAGWRMFNRYDGTWVSSAGRGGASWVRLHECGLSLVVVDITAPSKPCKEN